MALSPLGGHMDFADDGDSHMGREEAKVQTLREEETDLTMITQLADEKALNTELQRRLAEKDRELHILTSKLSTIDAKYTSQIEQVEKHHADVVSKRDKEIQNASQQLKQRDAVIKKLEARLATNEKNVKFAEQEVKKLKHMMAEQQRKSNSSIQLLTHTLEKKDQKIAILSRPPPPNKPPPPATTPPALPPRGRSITSVSSPSIPNMDCRRHSFSSPRPSPRGRSNSKESRNRQRERELEMLVKNMTEEVSAKDDACASLSAELREMSRAMQKLRKSLSAEKSKHEQGKRSLLQKIDALKAKIATMENEKRELSVREARSSRTSRTVSPRTTGGSFDRGNEVNELVSGMLERRDEINEYKRRREYAAGGDDSEEYERKIQEKETDLSDMMIRMVQELQLRDVKKQREMTKMKMLNKELSRTSESLRRQLDEVQKMYSTEHSLAIKYKSRVGVLEKRAADQEAKEAVLLTRVENLQNSEKAQAEKMKKILTKHNNVRSVVQGLTREYQTAQGKLFNEKLNRVLQWRLRRNLKPWISKWHTRSSEARCDELKHQLDETKKTYVTHLRKSAEIAARKQALVDENENLQMAIKELTNGLASRDALLADAQQQFENKHNKTHRMLCLRAGLQKLELGLKAQALGRWKQFLHAGRYKGIQRSLAATRDKHRADQAQYRKVMKLVKQHSANLAGKTQALEREVSLTHRWADECASKKLLAVVFSKWTCLARTERERKLHIMQRLRQRHQTRLAMKVFRKWRDVGTTQVHRSDIIAEKLGRLTHRYRKGTLQMALGRWRRAQVQVHIEHCGRRQILAATRASLEKMRHEKRRAFLVWRASVLSSRALRKAEQFYVPQLKDQVRKRTVDKENYKSDVLLYKNRIKDLQEQVKIQVARANEEIARAEEMKREVQEQQRSLRKKQEFIDRIYRGHQKFMADFQEDSTFGRGGDNQSEEDDSTAIAGATETKRGFSFDQGSSQGIESPSPNGSTPERSSCAPTVATLQEEERGTIGRWSLQGAVGSMDMSQVRVGGAADTEEGKGSRYPVDGIHMRGVSAAISLDGERTSHLDSPLDTPKTQQPEINEVIGPMSPDQEIHKMRRIIDQALETEEDCKRRKKATR